MRVMKSCVKPVIAVNKLVVGRGRPRLVVDDFTVEGPGLVQLIGPNGSGKTSLIRAMLGLERDAEGRVSLCGVNVARRPDLAGRFAAYLPQDAPSRAPTIPLTVGEMLEVALEARGVDVGNGLREIKALGLNDDLLDAPISRLSGGLRQRVYLAKALATGRPILFLDEPFSSLDPEARVVAARRILEVARERLVVVSSHDPELLIRGTNLVVLLSKGRMVAAGPPEDVLVTDVLRRVYGDLVVEMSGHIHIGEGH